MTTRDVSRAWLACPGDTAVDALALLALDAIAERDALRGLLHAALDVAQSQDAQIDRLREIIADLRARLPQEQEAA